VTFGGQVRRGVSAAAAGDRQQQSTPQENNVNLFNRFVREDEGQDLIEYALLAGLISLVCVLAITQAGEKVKGLFEAVTAAIPGAVAP
jgi:pilus assembly protein Flp/PilA